MNMTTRIGGLFPVLSSVFLWRCVGVLRSTSFPATFSRDSSLHRRGEIDSNFQVYMPCLFGRSCILQRYLPQSWGSRLITFRASNLGTHA